MRRDDFELEERGAGGHRVLRLGLALAVVLVGVAVLVLERLAVAPLLERLLRLPTGEHEVAVVAGDGAEQHELLETGLLVDGAGAGGETGFELVALALGDLDGVDLHDGHGRHATPSTLCPDTMSTGHQSRVLKNAPSGRSRTVTGAPGSTAISP